MTAVLPFSVMLGDRRIAPLGSVGRASLFMLPAATQQVRLVADRPAGVGPTERRGIAIERMTVRSGDEVER